MKRRHSMPFGAETDGTGTRFRLWAPAASEVVLHWWQGEHQHQRAMPRDDTGWCELRLDGVAAGTRYAFRIDDRVTVPDPASRSNPDDVHRPSEVIDAGAYRWRDANWRGRRWEDAVVYELHVGTFTQDGTFTAAISRLDYLLQLGVTAIELMPVADFPGSRNWGYDGVLLYAPDASYGSPDDLKRLIDAAHQRGLMVLLDVVYNHFGPDGNYLHAYAPQFFTERHQTPWGAAINYDGPGSRTVRDFMIHNALYWLEEFHFDGLRLDAVHAIKDDSTPHLIAELAGRVRTAFAGRQVHLVLENDYNEARWLEPDAAAHANAQWNDDVHHAAHVLLTGEDDGYYIDYADDAPARLARGLAQGFVYQGEPSRYRDGERRGERSSALPSTAFVNYTQTHDQVGNRAFGERLAELSEPQALRAVTACLLLAPSIPMLFMGEEFAAATPFQFFCDFDGELAAAVTAGRRKEFARFARFAAAEDQAEIPDPNQRATFVNSKLDWDQAAREPHASMLQFYRECLHVRCTEILPRLPARADHHQTDGSLLRVAWTMADGSRLQLLANLGDAAIDRSDGDAHDGRVLHQVGDIASGRMDPWSMRVTLRSQ